MTRYGLDELGKDVVRGLRSLAATPVITLASALCLGVGIAAATTLFSFVDSVLLRPLPVAEPEELVRLYVRYQGGFDYGSFSYPEFQDLQERNQVFSGLAAEQFTSVQVGDQAPRRVWGSLVSDRYFEVLGVEPALGTGFAGFAPDRAVPPSVVLSHHLWSRRFGADPSIVGRSVRINGRPFAVMGIAPEEFTGATVGLTTDLWLPLEYQEMLMPGRTRRHDRSVRWLYLLGRLRPDTSLAAAKENLDVVQDRLAAEHGEELYAGIDLHLLPYLRTRVPPNARSGFFALLAVGGVVVAALLLIACANVAGLLLARGAARRRSMAVQLALGSGRRRLFYQLLVESVLLALAGGVLGILATLWLVRGIRAVRLPVEVPVGFDLALDLRVLVFALLLSLLTSLLFGLAPGLAAARTNLSGLLVEGGERSSGRSRLRRLLVAGQVAATMLLLSCAGLFLRALDRAAEIDPGFAVEEVLVASLEPGLNGYDEERGRAFYRQLVERVSRRPGVRSAALGRIVPLGLGSLQAGVQPAGRELPPGEVPLVDYNVVGTGYFETLGVGLLQGRTFTSADDSEAPPVAVIGESLADRLWGDGEAVGRRLRALDREMQVVGVVDDIHAGSLQGEAEGMLFVPFQQQYHSAMTLHVRSSEAGSEALPALVRREVRALDPELPVYDMKWMRDQVRLALLPARLASWLLGVFGVLGLLLATVGLYGLISYSVNQRQREIGIRMAMGAGHGEVQRMVLGQGALLVVAGILLGLLLTVALGSALSGLLYGVSPADPFVLATTAVVIVAIALAATYFPARRAARLRPMDALRVE